MQHDSEPRKLTSHERSAGQPWNASYCGAAPPPWEIGRVQPAIERLLKREQIGTDVLDAGCGTGENALYLASLGRRVLGIDVAEAAIASAREKAELRGVDARFLVHDALRLERLGESFDAVFDCGLFHAFDADERRVYARGLRHVLRVRAAVYLLCFADEGTNIGPHPVSRAEIRQVFGQEQAWNTVEIVP